MPRGLLLALGVVFGCSDTAAPVPQAQPTANSERPPCTAGFRAEERGRGCVPILPPRECPPGTRSQVGSVECVAVGVTRCAAGFERAEGGWGCSPILTQGSCPQAERPRLGVRDCVPVASCDAFPPPEATHFVRADYAAVELDKTHFRTIGAAIAAAPSGATVAIDRGTYVESVDISKPVTLVGRCPAETLVSGAGTATKGLLVRTRDVSLRGFTIDGFEYGMHVVGRLAMRDVIVRGSRRAGIFSAQQATLELSNVVVEGGTMVPGTREAYGLLVQQGSTARVEDSVFADNEFTNVAALDAGTSLRVSRSIIKSGRSSSSANALSSAGVGAVAGKGATFDIEESAIVDNRENGVLLLESGATVSIRGSVVAGTRPSDSADGAGLFAFAGSAFAEETTFAENGRTDVALQGAAEAELTSVTIARAAGKAAPATEGAALVTEGRARATLRSVAALASRNLGLRIRGTGSASIVESLVADTAPVAGDIGGYALAVAPHSVLAMSRSTVRNATAASLLLDGGIAKLSEVLVTHTRSRAGSGGNAISVQTGGTVEVERSAFVSNRSIAIGVISEGSRASVVDSTIMDTDSDDGGSFGMGVFVAGASASILRTTILSSKSVGVAFASGSGLLDDSVLANNTVAMHAQGGSTLAETGEPRPLFVLVSATTRLIENGARLGSGLVPVPTPF